MHYWKTWKRGHTDIVPCPLCKRGIIHVDREKALNIVIKFVECLGCHSRFKLRKLTNEGIKIFPVRD